MRSTRPPAPLQTGRPYRRVPGDATSRARRPLERISLLAPRGATQAAGWSPAAPGAGGPDRNHLRPVDRDAVGAPAARTRLRGRDDVLAPAARLAARRRLGPLAP